MGLGALVGLPEIPDIANGDLAGIPLLDGVPMSGDDLTGIPGFRGSSFSIMLPLRPGAGGEYRAAELPRALIAELNDGAQTLEWGVPVSIDGRRVDISGASSVDFVTVRPVGGPTASGTEDDRPWVRPAVVAAAMLTGVAVWRLARERRASP